MLSDFSEINFLASSYRTVKRQQKTDLTYVRFAAGLFILLVITWGGLKIYNLNLVKQIAALNAQEAQVNDRLQRLAADQTPYLNYVAKAKAISQIIANRRSGMQLGKVIDEYLTSRGATVNSMRFNQSEATLEITIAMHDVQEMDRIIFALEEDDFKDQFALIKKQSLGRNMEGVYNTTLLFELE
ncbi:hypothetical protein FWH30_01930 [Microgenomates group bacterium]|nr:hypothetical protein [Microgenomates group bacterium]